MRYDYELLPSRKPKFLAQTAAHVSGAAFYYQQSDVTDQPWAGRVMPSICLSKNKKKGTFVVVAVSPPQVSSVLSVCSAEDVWSLHSPELRRLVCHPGPAGV